MAEKEQIWEVKYLSSSDEDDVDEVTSGSDGEDEAAEDEQEELKNTDDLLDKQFDRDMKMAEEEQGFKISQKMFKKDVPGQGQHVPTIVR